MSKYDPPNPILLIDGYKLDHRRQYPPGTEYVYANWTPRAARDPEVKEAVFFGLQYFLDRYLNDEIGGRWMYGQTHSAVAHHYKRRVDGYLGPNEIGTDHIVELHKLGYLPLDIRALPEGTLCPMGVPMLTIENTHKDFFWLPNYLETLLSNILWLPCTSATTAYRYRKLLDTAALVTGGDPAFVSWQGHDFSYRGLCGLEAAMLSGAGHLLSFTGTDTIPALDFIEEYYGTENAGGSVAATEHSVMCAGGQESEIETFRRLLKLYPAGVLSVVSDTWDLWKVLTEYVPTLKQEIMARNGKLVIRPDSGDPVKIICGDRTLDYADKKNLPAILGVVQLLWDTFGGTVTKQGYKVLDSHIGVIYGDSITLDRADQICTGLRARGFASTNVVFGIGSYTYQHTTRDTLGFAMKATWAQINGVAHNLFKKPVTDSGVKFSARGRLAVLPGSHTARPTLVQEATPDLIAQSMLEPVYLNGKVLRRQTFGEIRQRLHPARVA